MGATGAETEGAAAERALSVETAGLSVFGRAMSKTWGACHKTHVSSILGGDAAPNGYDETGITDKKEQTGGDKALFGFGGRDRQCVDKDAYLCPGAAEE